MKKICMLEIGVKLILNDKTKSTLRPRQTTVDIGNRQSSNLMFMICYKAKWVCIVALLLHIN